MAMKASSGKRSISRGLTSGWLLLVSGGFSLTRAEFGNFVDPTFNCPASTTCQRVCVADASLCPEDMRCGPNETLCEDGTCANTFEGGCGEDLETPCEFKCAPVACAKVVRLFDMCDELYGELYETEAICGEIETLEETSMIGFNEPVFIFAYVWVPLLTLTIFGWCAFNQRIFPVEGSTTTLQVDSEAKKNLVNCTQTGYKYHWLGSIIYALTCATIAMWITILALLTIQYYVVSGNQYVDKRKIHIEDEQQLLKTYIIVWNVAFVWCFTLKWPHSIKSIFWRRCILSEASIVAVYLEVGAAAEAKPDKNIVLGHVKKVFSMIFQFVHLVGSFLFSDDGQHLSDTGYFKYCKVQYEPDGLRYFVFLFRRYNLQLHGSFTPGAWHVAENLEDFSGCKGLTTQEVHQRYREVGRNVIDMEEPTVMRVIKEEFVKPFYTYQMFMIWSWFPMDYFYMALVWSVVVLTSASTVIWFRYKHLRNLYGITLVSGEAQVFRDGNFIVIDQADLAPGDLVKLNPGITYSDMIVVSGGTTLVDESALTGETTPQPKIPIDMASNVKYQPDLHKRHTLSAGTTVLETDDAMAVVLKTASYTAKGELLREIFSFRRHRFKFDTEVVIVIAILVVYAIIAFNIVVAFIEDSSVYAWFYGIYVVGTILPPLLPTVFTVSVGVSDNRLGTKRIACANSESILIAGKVDTAFFDKTGTLTKQGLEFLHARSANDWSSHTVSSDLSLVMSACHSLTQSKSGYIVGNPVDVTMFGASGARLASSEGATGSPPSIVDATGKTLEVVRVFEFDHHRMTQAVLVKLPSREIVAVVKGSGESICKICKPETLPKDIHHVMHQSASAGHYQISTAMKRLPGVNAQVITRDEVEMDLDFVGVLNFSNVIRENTPDVIKQLKEGRIHPIMVTGDNVLTGIRIAREAGIMDPEKAALIGTTDSAGKVTWANETGEQVSLPTFQELDTSDVEIAMSGKAWEVTVNGDKESARQLSKFVRVFGRCTPRDKVSVVDAFVDDGCVTLMCGDGGNDCGALKAAHVGVALSDAEASIVAPFTSLDRCISSVPEVLREGRCALASALATYKYIIMYGQVETINQIINAYFQITFSEWCWVFMDGIWTISLAFTLPQSRPATRLSPTRPTASVLGLHTLSSALGVLALNFAFTVLALGVLWNQDWFQCRKWDDNDVSSVLVIGDNYESSVLFLVTGFQYIASAMAFNFGYEFRQGWFKNYSFVALAMGYTFMHFYITMKPGKLSCFWRVNCVNENVVTGVTARERMPIQNPYNTTTMPEEFRWKILVIMIANGIAIAAYEYFIVNGIRQRVAAKRLEQADASNAK